MIPVKLNLRNFMCYRENVPALSFTGIHTACICGDNGNGKSAIIDAITWALWGKTRAKNDIDLISQGQSEVAVEFDFTVSGQMYRIIRKYAKPKTRTGSGHPVLDFQAFIDGSFHSMSGNTLSQTEQKIIDVLHMNYDTFTNSVFLRQGHADEFTTKRPGERKDVLARILDLARYDEFEEKAKDKVKFWDGKAATVKTLIDRIDEDLKVKPECEADLLRTRSEESRIENLVLVMEAKVSTLQKQYDSLEAKKTQLTQLDQYITEIKRTINGLMVRMEKIKEKISGFETLIKQRSDIDSGYSQLMSERKLNDDLNHSLSLMVKLNDRKNNLEKVIEKAKNDLLRQHAVIQHNINELSRKVEKLPQMKTDLQEVERQQAILNKQETELESKKSAIQENRIGINKLETDQTQLRNEITEISKKISMLSSDKEAKCPLCGQELGPEEHEQINARYNEDKDEKTRSIRSLQVDIAKERTRLSSLEKEVYLFESKIKKDRALYQGQVSVLRKSINDALESTDELNKEKIELHGIEQKLNDRSYAFSEQESLIGISTKISEINYDPALHEQVRRNIVKLTKYEEPKRKLEEAERLITFERESLSYDRGEVEKLNDNLEKNLKQYQGLSGEIKVLPQLSNDLSAAKKELESLKSELRIIQDTRARLTEKLDRCVQLELSRTERLKEMRNAEEETRIYRDLMKAFGKKGIQALLIEMTVPEIEVEADRLLAKMTDNRMHIKIETQKETKKGDIAETLDINISDELGTRNYEMFSGGEAFRINFAIRIALSRLLARRAGAPLPTLIIDEGFGTQDINGIERLKEAITSIQDEFDKILVITHIEELKDAFPTRIDIVKTQEGATISLN